MLPCGLQASLQNRPAQPLAISVSIIAPTVQAWPLHAWPHPCCLAIRAPPSGVYRRARPVRADSALSRTPESRCLSAVRACRSTKSARHAQQPNACSDWGICQVGFVRTDANLSRTLDNGKIAYTNSLVLFRVGLIGCGDALSKQRQERSKHCARGIARPRGFVVPGMMRTFGNQLSTLPRSG